MAWVGLGASEYISEAMQGWRNRLLGSRYHDLPSVQRVCDDRRHLETSSKSGLTAQKSESERCVRAHKVNPCAEE